MLKKEKEEEIQLIEDIRDQIGAKSETFIEQLKADEARNQFIQSQKQIIQQSEQKEAQIKKKMQKVPAIFHPEPQV